MSKLKRMTLPIILISIIFLALAIPKQIQAEEKALELKEDEHLIALTDESRLNEELLLERYISDAGQYKCVKQLQNGQTVYTHHYSESAIKEPTCTETGYERYICDVCHEEVTEEFPRKDHVVENGVCVNCGRSEASVEREDELKQESEVVELFDLESAYSNYLRMPSNQMREAYLESLSNENRQLLEGYIKDKIKEFEQEKSEFAETSEQEITGSEEQEISEGEDTEDEKGN